MYLKVDVHRGLAGPGFLELVVDVQLDVVVGHAVNDAQEVPLAGNPAYFRTFSTRRWGRSELRRGGERRGEHN